MKTFENFNKKINNYEYRKVLHNSIFNRDINIFENYLSKIDISPKLGKSSILHLLINDNAPIEYIKLVLEKGINPNLTDYNNSTPLMYATNNKQIDLVKLLLEYDADPDLKNNNQVSSFLISNLDEITILFIDNGSDVNQLDIKNQNILLRRSFTLKLSQKNVIKKLSENNFNFNHTTNQNQTILHLLNRNKQFLMLSLNLLEYVDWTIQDNNGKFFCDDLDEDFKKEIFNLYPQKYQECLRIKAAKNFNI